MSYLGTFIGTIYFIQNIIAVLIIISLVITSFNINSKPIKTISSIVMLVLMVMHYYLLYMISFYEKITIYPFVVIESINRYGAASIDIGQIILVALLWIWRRELREWMPKIVKNIAKTYSKIREKISDHIKENY